MFFVPHQLEFAGKNAHTQINVNVSNYWAIWWKSVRQTIYFSLSSVMLHMLLLERETILTIWISCKFTEMKSNVHVLFIVLISCTWRRDWFLPKGKHSMLTLLLKANPHVMLDVAVLVFETKFLFLYSINVTVFGQSFCNLKI